MAFIGKYIKYKSRASCVYFPKSANDTCR